MRNRILAYIRRVRTSWLMAMVVLFALIDIGSYTLAAAALGFPVWWALLFAAIATMVAAAVASVAIRSLRRAS